MKANEWSRGRDNKNDFKTPLNTDGSEVEEPQHTEKNDGECLGEASVRDEWAMIQTQESLQNEANLVR